MAFRGIRIQILWVPNSVDAPHSSLIQATVDSTTRGFKSADHGQSSSKADRRFRGRCK